MRGVGIVAIYSSKRTARVRDTASQQPCQEVFYNLSTATHGARPSQARATSPWMQQNPLVLAP